VIESTILGSLVFLLNTASHSFVCCAAIVVMHLPTVLSVAFAALASAEPGPKNATKGLDYYAKMAGLKYFGSATDTPGQRERASLEAAYEQYDKIMWSGEFGQTTPTNGMKVLASPSLSLPGMIPTAAVALHRT